MDNELFFGIRLKKTGEMLSSQVTRILSDKKIKFEPRCIYLLIILRERAQASIKEIAAFLGMTHPAIVQMVNSLKNIGLITQSKSVEDKRITLIELTEKGKGELNRIKPVLTEIEYAVESISNEIDANLKYWLSKLNEAVKSKLLLQKVHEGLKQKAIQEINIVPYNRKYKSDFARLNYEWLEKYFKTEKAEAEDKRLLNNPEREIIKKEGEIFFAILNNIVVGTCAVLTISDSIYELAKMGVTEKAQGRQIGKKLALTAIGYAVEKGALKLRLYTNSKLNAAMNLYRGLGFIEVKEESNDRYKRELILMELDLTM
ncbi:MAG: bifunctional helix-turn-helix transcriptional regulator/GNAT family N-acetyltransferase [Ignavibacteriaceae bacterium]|jgi:DNA-binding MarR family transcriptional regulator/ribosomal protein S18 acetylase RimI-like enzyme